MVISLLGRGEAEVDGVVWALDAGSWAKVPGGSTHSFRNTGEGDFAFVCIVPANGDPHAKKYKEESDGSAENAEKLRGGNAC